MRFRAFIGCLIWLAGLLPLAAQALPNNDQVFGDWKATCGKDPEGVERCQVFQALSLKKEDKQLPLLTVMVGYPPEQTQALVRFRVPLGVLLPAGLGFRIDDRKATQLGYSHCDQSGCWSSLQLSDNELWAMKAGKQAFVIFTDLNKKSFSIPVSLKGFTAAVKSLQ